MKRFYIISLVIFLLLLLAVALILRNPQLGRMRDEVYFEQNRDYFESLVLEFDQVDCGQDPDCIILGKSPVPVVCTRPIPFISVRSPSSRNYIFIPSESNLPVSILSCGSHINCNIQLDDHWFLCDVRMYG